MSAAATAQFILMYAIMPVWIAAGFADWLCHRRTDIEHTSGVKESLIHLLMFAEVGLPLMAALFLEINALVIAFMVVMFFIHQATALWDVSYAVGQREVKPIEQHVHSFLEMIPLMGIALVVVSHSDQFTGLVFMDGTADFGLSLKHDPLPPAYLALVLLSAFLFSALPYLLELRRGMKAARAAG